MPTSAPFLQPGENDDPALAYALHQLSWYERAKVRARRVHYASELLILFSTASTVIVSALRAPAVATATLAAVTLFLTGFRQVFNPNERWVSTSVAWLALQQAVTGYQLLAVEERDDAARRALLDRTIEVMTAESRSWTEQRMASQAGSSAALARQKPA
ncbi:MAG TPA: DUF4231 domain-containing protein [Thermoleophilia bacterium]|jgi:hypothetical protein|nr:DUF4231 domain-containing protein [Thermoleophilia bacterium]